MRFREGGRRPATVGELVDARFLVIGDGYRAKNAELGAEGIPFARAGNVRAGFVFEDADRLLPNRISNAGQKISKLGDVVFTSKGTVGRFGFVTATTPKFAYSPQLCFWRVLDSNVICPRFLYFWMRGDECRRQFNALKGQTDMADYISLRDQRGIEIIFPSLGEQEAVVSVLASLDDKIDSNRQLVLSEDKLSSALFERIHIHAVGRPVSLGECVELIPGRSYASKDLDDPEETTGLLTLKAIRSGGGFSSEGIRHYSGRYNGTQVVNPGDIIVAHTDLTQRATVLGFPAIARSVAGFDRLIACMHVPVVRPKGGSLPTSFLYYLLRSADFHGYAYANAHGSTVMMLNRHVLLDFSTQLPSAEKLVEFDSVVAPLIARASLLEAECETLARVRDSLLPKLISGEIRVPDTVDPEEVIGPAAEALAGAEL